MKIKKILSLFYVVSCLSFTINAEEIKNISFSDNDLNSFESLEVLGYVEPLTTGLNIIDKKKRDTQLKEIEVENDFIKKMKTNVKIMENKTILKNIEINNFYDTFDKLTYQFQMGFEQNAGERLFYNLNYDNKNGKSNFDGYIKTKFDNFSLELGSTELKWGPSYFSSLSIGTCEKVDLFRINMNYKNLDISYFTSRDAEKNGYFSKPKVNEVFFGGLRADYKLNKNITIGAGNTIVSYKPFEFELLFTDALGYFTNLIEPPEESQNRDVNQIGNADISIIYPNLFKVYGEYIWDSTVGVNELEIYHTKEAGAKDAYLLGVLIPILKEDCIYEIRGEYSSIDDVVYEFSRDKNLKYNYKNKQFGHIAGTNSRSLFFEFKKANIKNIVKKIQYGLVVDKERSEIRNQFVRYEFNKKIKNLKTKLYIKYQTDKKFETGLVLEMNF